jgi:LPS sulfotransferase NodH
MGATINGIYGVKVVAPQLGRVDNETDPFRDLPNLTLIRLQRKDLLGQAISFARARQTKQYTSLDRHRVDPAYSTELIRLCLRSLREQEAIWDAAIGRLGIRPLAISYEDILEDPQSVVDQIASAVGIAPSAAIDWARVQVRMQRDSHSAEWRDRFLEETGDEFRVLSLTPPPRQASRDSASAS